MDLYNTGVRSIIDNHLLEKSKEKRDYGDYWSASQAGYCMRKVIFERLGVPHVSTDDDARKQRVFTAGHLFHDWIQQLTKEAGISIAQELELQDEDLMIKGHIDDLVLVSYDESGAPARKGDEIRAQHPILYDYKTRNSRSFSRAKQPSHYHKMQLGTYMYMLRKDNGNSILWRPQHADVDINGVGGLTEARILSIEKDTLRMAEVVYMYTPALEKEVYEYWSTLNGYWAKRTMPKCTCGDYENGFMADERWNPYYYDGEPCSLSWFNKCKEEGLINGLSDKEENKEAKSKRAKATDK